MTSYGLFLGIFFSHTLFVLYNFTHIGELKGELKNAEENHLKYFLCYIKPFSCLCVSSAQLRRVSRPRFTGLPPERHLHRSVELLCPPPGHGREAGLLAAHLQIRVSALTYCTVSLADDVEVFRTRSLLLQSQFQTVCMKTNFILSQQHPAL